MHTRETFEEAGERLPAGISVVVPVYNSEPTLELLLGRLAGVLETAAGAGAFEVIFVNDASRDRSWEVVTRLSANHPWVMGIDLMRNYGQHNALLCGIRAARFDTIVTLDDDLQNPPEEVPKLIAKMGDGFDVVYGKPRQMRHGLWRNLASRVTKLMLRPAMGGEVAGNVSAFRAFRTHLRRAFANYQGSYVSIDVLLTWGTTRFAVTPVDHQSREVGVSNYTFRKLLTHALNMMTGFSTVPLQLTSLLGFACTLLGVLLLIYVLVRYLVAGTSVPGFPFLASVIAIFSGAQLFALGIMGEYLARIHLRTMDRPTFAVRDRTGGR
ncbi:MAG: glycosyl transferase [Phycisphaerales bacterium]|nr:glycosyl transferase [Phycisphaerales bacterium]